MNSGKRITKDVYDRIVEAFRADPGNSSAASRLARVNIKTARKAWERGYPKAHFEPIRVLFAREAHQARAKLMAKQAARKATDLREREDAIKHAAAARAQEGQMVSLARGSALQGLTISVNLVSSARKLAARTKHELDRIADIPVGDPDAPTVEWMLAKITKVTDLMVRINSNAHTAMQMERLHLGAPQDVGGIITKQTEMSMEEASTRVEMASNALQDARRVGGLHVIAGGRAKPTVGKLVHRADVAESHEETGVVTAANLAV